MLPSLMYQARLGFASLMYGKLNQALPSLRSLVGVIAIFTTGICSYSSVGVSIDKNQTVNSSCSVALN